MAVNAYLIIQGVEGPSTTRKNAIDIYSFSFGASMPVSIQQAGGESRAGRANFQDVSVMKAVDKTSPQLFQDCISGDFLTKVEVIYDKPMGDKQEDYFKIEMENAIITSISLSGSNENPVESLSFAFKKIKVSYNPEVDKSLQGFVDKGFDLEKLVAW
ncbi:MAG: type VI secretion system tube protein Hcp [Acidobacteriota bacterium]|nr:type VI secretion system tube protein Hcp [Acidobacteriota bacterium]